MRCPAIWVAPGDTKVERAGAHSSWVASGGTGDGGAPVHSTLVSWGANALRSWPLTPPQLGVDEDGELAPRTPIEDEDNVDERRAAIGLGTLEEYYEEFRDAVDAEPSPSP